MVAAEDDGEDHEEEEDDQEEKEDSLDVVLHLCLLQVIGVRVVDSCVGTRRVRDSQRKDLLPCLEEQEEEELAVVQLTYASSDPEAVVVELPYAPIALPAVPTSVRLLNIAYFTEPLLRHIYLNDVLHAFRVFLLLCLLRFLRFHRAIGGRRASISALQKVLECGATSKTCHWFLPHLAYLRRAHVVQAHVYRLVCVFTALRGLLGSELQFLKSFGFFAFCFIYEAWIFSRSHEIVDGRT